MKTTLIFTLALFFTIISNPIQAQDASNDATWEETIDFIKKNESYMKAISSRDFRDIGVSINDYNTIVTVTENHYYHEKNTANLDKLQKVYSSGRLLTLRFVGPNVLNGLYVKKSGFLESKKHVDFFKVSVDDSEMEPRLVKAFEHLAYLATEKRKAAREASGEKF